QAAGVVARGGANWSAGCGEISLGGLGRNGRAVVTIIARDFSLPRTGVLALRGPAEPLRPLVQNAPLALCSIEARERFEHVARKWLEIAGRKPDDIVGRPIVDICPHHPHVIETVRRAVLGESFTAVVPIDEVVWEARFNSGRDEHGEPIGVVGVAIDVTE